MNFSSAIFKLVNLSAVKTQGVEFETEYVPMPALRFGVDFGYTFWKLRDSTDPLRNVPHATGGLHANWRISKRANVRGDAQVMSRRYDFEIPVPASTTVGGYTDVDLWADYELNSSFTAYVRGDNVFDSHFHEYVGFPNRGISVRVGLIYRVPGKP